SFIVASCDSQSKRTAQADFASVQMQPTAAAAPALDATIVADSAVPAAFSAARAPVVGGVAISAEGRRRNAPNPQAPVSPQSPQEVAAGSMLVRTGQASLQVDSLEV